MDTMREIFNGIEEAISLGRSHVDAVWAFFKIKDGKKLYKAGEGWTEDKEKAATWSDRAVVVKQAKRDYGLKSDSVVDITKE